MKSLRERLGERGWLFTAHIPTEENNLPSFCFSRKLKL